MDAVGRSWPLVLIATLGAATAGACAKAPLAAVGTSDRAPTSRAGAPSAPGPVVPTEGNPLPDDFRERFAKVKAPFTSSGHAAGRWRAQVYANETGLHALETGGREVAVGALVVEEHAPLVDGGAPAPRFVMEKRAPGYAPAHGDWRYVAFGSAGRIVADGPVDGCAGCHDAAPAGRLFPIVP